ncbi:hypothetical protein JCM10213v2_007753 [Rhodosporidiobolus nylandii]
MPLPTLPDLVLHLILVLALPRDPLSPSTLPRRYSHLLRYTRVCRQFARVAQQLLYTHIDLCTSIAADELCAAVDKSVGARRLAFTRARTLRIGRPQREVDKDRLISKGDVRQVLTRLPGLREIWIDAVVVEALDLSVCAELKSLHLSRLPLLYDFPSPLPEPTALHTWHLPQLVSLSLTRVYFRSTSESSKLLPLAHLLSPLALPSLKCLELSYSPASSTPAFAALAPQLERLWLRRTRGRQDDLPDLPETSLSALSPKLQHLALDISSRGDIEILSSLPFDVQLRSLRIFASSSLAVTVERALLSASPHCIEQLAFLMVEDVSNLPPASVIQNAQVRQKTRQECEARGVELLEYPAGEEEEYDKEGWRRTCDEVDRVVELKKQEELGLDSDEELIVELAGVEVAASGDTRMAGAWQDGLERSLIAPSADPPLVSSLCRWSAFGDCASFSLSRGLGRATGCPRTATMAYGSSSHGQSSTASRSAGMSDAAYGSNAGAGLSSSYGAGRSSGMGGASSSASSAGMSSAASSAAASADAAASAESRAMKHAAKASNHAMSLEALAADVAPSLSATQQAHLSQLVENAHSLGKSAHRVAASASAAADHSESTDAAHSGMGGAAASAAEMGAYGSGAGRSAGMGSSAAAARMGAYGSSSQSAGMDGYGSSGAGMSGSASRSGMGRSSSMSVGGAGYYTGY